MKTRKRQLAFTPMPTTHEELCRLFPPRPIRDAVDHTNATEIIRALAGFPLNQDQEDYLEVLSQLVGTYEDEHHARKLRKMKPIEILRDLMQQNQLTTSQLGELLGNRSLGSKLLRSERELSKTHIRILAQRFKISPALLMD